MTTAYDAILYQVGGQIELVDLSADTTKIQWERSMDDMDKGTVTIKPSSVGCCGKIPHIRPYLHEMSLVRDGHDVFIGPVTIGPSGIRPDIVAGGMTDWFDVRFVRDFYDHTGAEVPTSQVIDELVRSAMLPAEPGVLAHMENVTNSTPNDRKTSITPVVHEMLWDDHLSRMVGTQTHMSTHGRRVSFWPARTALRYMGVLTDVDFANPAPIYRDGRIYATAAAVWNSDNDSPAGGYAGGIHPDWGILVERAERDDKATTATAAYGAAKLVSLEVPLRSSDANGFRLEFTCDSTVQFHLIQPGNTFDIELSQGCLPFSALMQVTKVGDTYENGVSHPYIVVKELT